ncbi:hypothetical protein B0T16DRAFT_440314 [Cercophora newfieldiana]|uniref:Uncharacterized protein n=1 Tax=Cercophora newfieldiana TaxID=92897 RepID=A0AA39YLR4_9PEZI|nr:hypothetical protein B0T16DRAFT_440314 [Cercophora newfieldiana]
MDIEQIPRYDVEVNPAPTLTTSVHQDTRHVYILSHGEHSAAVLILCSPVENPHIRGEKYHAISSYFVICCEGREEVAGAFHAYIDKTVNNSFKPGLWLAGGCTTLPPGNADAPCEEKSRQGPLQLFEHLGSVPSQDEDSAADSEPAPGDAVSTVQSTAKAMVKKFSAGLAVIISDGVRYHGHDTPGDQLASYRRGSGDNGSLLEDILWQDAVKQQHTATEASFTRKYLFGNLAAKNYILSSISRSTEGEQSQILTSLADRLLRLAISLPLSSRVLVAPVYLTYNQQRDNSGDDSGRSYEEFCSATGLSSLKSLKFTAAEFEQYQWGIPVQDLLKKEQHEKLQITSTDGVEFLTYSAGQEAVASDSDRSMPEGTQRVTVPATIGSRTGAGAGARETDGRQPPPAEAAAFGLLSPAASQQHSQSQSAWPSTSHASDPQVPHSQWPLIDNQRAPDDWQPHDSHLQPLQGRWNPINGQEPTMQWVLTGPVDYMRWHASLVDPNLGAEVDAMQTEGQEPNFRHGSMYEPPTGNTEDGNWTDAFDDAANVDGFHSPSGMRGA